MKKYDKNGQNLTKDQLRNKVQILEGIALQMYRLLNSIEKSGTIDGQLFNLFEIAMNEYMTYIKEEV